MHNPMGVQSCRNVAAAGAVSLALWSNLASAQPPKPSPDPVERPDIIVTGKRLRTIQDKDIVDRISASVIKAYGVDSVGDLLNRLSARFGRNFSVVVNGRRLSTLDAINALPPEALEGIELLRQGKSSEYGFPSNDAVINLSLRPRFDFATIEGGAGVTTEGAGDARDATLRYSRIRQERRINFALSYNRQGGIRESDRATLALVGQAVTGQYRSLVPRQDSFLFTAGYARPIGALNLEVSAEAAFARTTSLTGLAYRNQSGDDPDTIVSALQDNVIGSWRSGSTISGNIGRFFGSLLLNGEVSKTRVRNSAGNVVTVANIANENITPLGPDIRSQSVNMGATFTFNGALFNLPMGAVNIDGSLGGRWNSFTSAFGDNQSNRTGNRYTATTAQVGLTIPIAQQGGSSLGWLGNLFLAERIDFTRNSGIGQAITHTSSLEWSPTSRLQISLSRTSNPSLPGTVVLFAPIVRRSGILVYDVASNSMVPVTILSGGRSDINQSKSTSESAQITHSAKLSFANVTSTIGYMTNRTTQPLLSFSNPSPLAQRLFTELFQRDQSGAIVEFDARPFNGENEVSRSFSLNIHLNGPVMKEPKSSNGEVMAIIAAAPPTGPSWDINLSYSYALAHTLRLLDGRSVDLLSTPLSLSGTGSARHHLNLQWAIGKERFGLNGSISWDSGSTVQSLDSEDASAIRYSALTKIGLEGFVELARSPKSENPGSTRLKLSIDNLLNQRLRIVGYSGLTGSIQRAMNDPYGRTIRLTLRKSL